METSTHEREYFEYTYGYWTNVTLAGVIAGVLMGVIMHSIMDMIHVVGILYGIESTQFGWAFHLLHAVVFALIFGLLFLWNRLEPFRDRVLASTTIGIAWGTILWLGAATVVMPLWLSAVGTGSGTPSIDPWSGLGHVLYGAVVGGGSSLLHRAVSEL